jgi:hypothetical protein
VEQAGGDRDDVELHVGEQVGDLERMDEVGLARVPDLPLCSKAEKTYARLSSSMSASGLLPDLFDEVLEPDHDVGV